MRGAGPPRGCGGPALRGPAAGAAGSAQPRLRLRERLRERERPWWEMGSWIRVMTSPPSDQRDGFGLARHRRRAVQQDHPVGEGSEVGVMGDEQHGAPAGRPAHGVDDGGGGLRVQGGGGLEQDEGGGGQRGAGEGETAALATGQPRAPSPIIVS